MQQMQSSPTMNEVTPYIRAIATEIGEENLCCDMCQRLAEHCETSNQQGYGPNECLIFQCTLSCKSKGWAYCKICKKRFGKSNVKDHQRSKTHRKRKSDLDVGSAQQKLCRSAVDVLVPSTTTKPLSGAGEAMEPHFTDHSTDLDATALDDNDAQSFNENLSANEVTLSVTLSKRNDKGVVAHPLLNMGLGNEWLATTFDALPLAVYTEVGRYFQNAEVMRAYWIAE